MQITDQIIIRIERHRAWDADNHEVTIARPWQCRMFRGPAAENRMVACGPYRATRTDAEADALMLRQGQFGA